MNSTPDRKTPQVGRSLLEMPPVPPPSAVGPLQHSEQTDQPRPRRRGSVRAWLAVAVVACVLAAVAVWRTTDDGPAPLSKADVNRAVKSGLKQAQKEQRAAPPDAATAYRTIGPSLVTVTTERRGTGKAAETGVALGAGVVINARRSRAHRPARRGGRPADPGPVRRRHAGDRAGGQQPTGERHRRPGRRPAPPGGGARGDGWRSAGRRRRLRGRQPAGAAGQSLRRRGVRDRPLRSRARTVAGSTTSSSSTQPSTLATAAGRCSTATGRWSAS